MPTASSLETKRPAIATDSLTSQVALHIIRIGDSLGSKVIGEGVETEVQADFLLKNGVQFAQGWLFHKAMPITRYGLSCVRKSRSPLWSTDGSDCAFKSGPDT